MKIKIAVILILIVPLLSHANENGYGPWPLGMSKDNVASIERYGPYKEVKATGGVETFNGEFNGKKRNISFVFGNDALNKIQIWVYEGKSQSEALGGWVEVYSYLKTQFGGVEFSNVSVPDNVDPLELRSIYAGVINSYPEGEVAKVQMAPIVMPGNMVVYASLFSHPAHGYYVFLYYTAP